MTNEELIRLAKQGDTASYEKLFERNSRWCYGVANRYPNVDELDDTAAVAKYGMYKAYESYDDSKGVKFLTYATTCMVNEILMHHRKMTRHKGNLHLEMVVNVDGEGEGNELTLADSLESELNIPENELDKRVVNEVLKSSIQVLNHRERQVIEGLYYRNKTQKEIAAELGITQSYACRLEKGILKKLKDVLTVRGIYGFE